MSRSATINQGLKPPELSKRTEGVDFDVPNPPGGGFTGKRVPIAAILKYHEAHETTPPDPAANIDLLQLQESVRESPDPHTVARCALSLMAVNGHGIEGVLDPSNPVYNAAAQIIVECGIMTDAEELLPFRNLTT